jgi:cytochrome c oxidase cbb3-type subunit III
MRTNLVIGLWALCALAVAQTPPAQPPGGRGGRGGAPAGGGGGFANAFPQHPPADPAMVDRGRAIYGVNCQFCHGGDARGGEGGPNLLRSESVLNDQNGEVIAPIVQNGRGDMPKFPMTTAQVADIAAFIHSFRVAGYDASRNKPPTILVGDAAAGEAYFKTKCATCHSVTGDLKGIGAKFAEPRDLQQAIVMPGSGGRGGGGVRVPPTTVTVTPASGPKAEGRLVRIDDFIVILADADGTQHSFRRDGERPKVEIHEPLAPHKALLNVYRDKDIHNLTAYLVTVK